MDLSEEAQDIVESLFRFVTTLLHIIEGGDAVADASGYVWTYTVTQTNDSLNGDKITVTISDLPDNTVQKTLEV
jgi:hypothetical protein